MTQERLLLLAPPGERIYHRDGFCGTSSKGSYYWPPLDLLIQSGIFWESGSWDITVMDAIAEDLSRERALARILDRAPHAVLSLASSISLRQDMSFLDCLKRRTGCKIIVSGDVFHFKPLECMEKFPFLDGILMNYTTRDALMFLEGRLDELQCFCHRGGETVVLRNEPSKEEYEYPAGRVELFPMDRYSTPLMRRRPMASFGTQVGCPMRCTFCSLCQIPFLTRKLENALEELMRLKAMGIRELFVRDYTFNARKQRTRKLLGRMIDENLGFSWICEMVPHGVDEELVGLLKQAGCHTILFGVESGDDEILRVVNKGIDTGGIRSVFRICRKAGIRTLAHFVLGYPQDTRESVERTIRFSSELEATFASFNLYVPRIGSRLAEELDVGMELGGDSLDSSEVKRSYCNQISARALLQLRQKAYVTFYLNPARMWRILASIRTCTELEGIGKNFGSFLFR